MFIRKFEGRYQLYFKKGTKRATAPSLIGVFGIYIKYKLGFIKIN